MFIFYALFYLSDSLNNKHVFFTLSCLLFIRKPQYIFLNDVKKNTASLLLSGITHSLWTLNRSRTCWFWWTLIENKSPFCVSAPFACRGFWRHPLPLPHNDGMSQIFTVKSSISKSCSPLTLHPHKVGVLLLQTEQACVTRQKSAFGLLSLFI